MPTFLIFAPKHRLWVLVRTASVVLNKNKKNIKNFLLKIFIFYNFKNHSILHGQVFVMWQEVVLGVRWYVFYSFTILSTISSISLIHYSDNIDLLPTCQSNIDLHPTCQSPCHFRNLWNSCTCTYPNRVISHVIGSICWYILFVVVFVYQLQIISYRQRPNLVNLKICDRMKLFK